VNLLIFVYKLVTTVVTNDGGSVFFAMVFICTKNQTYFVSMCCAHHNEW